MYTEFIHRYELAKVDVERGKFLLAEDDLIKKEDRLAKEKTELAMRRLRKEEKNAKQAERSLRTRDRFVYLYCSCMKLKVCIYH